MSQVKIKKIKELEGIAKKCRRGGKTVAALSGAFDILHPGHVSFLEQAKNKTDVLIVLLNSDASIKLYKHRSRPINKAGARAAVLAALRPVDFICVFNGRDPRKVLSKLRPDIFFQGSDWGKNCIEKDTVEKYGGKISVIKKIPGFSTTAIINKIQEVAKKQ